MIGRTNAGGRSALDFRVVGGTTQPSSPANKTIWVNTSTEISGWTFASSKPVSPSAGEVWFQTGTSSPAAFNALKENVLTVYPAACEQYVSGSWVKKEAKSYLSGSWVPWYLYLYTAGDVHSDVTGGYEALALKISADYGGNTLTATAPTLTTGGSSMSISLSNGSAGYNKSGSVLTKNKIDLSNYSSLTFKFTKSIGNTSNYATFYVSSSNSTNPVSAAAGEQVLGSSAATSVTLDVSSLSGEYYVGVNVLAGSAGTVTTTVTITEIVLQ